MTQPTTLSTTEKDVDTYDEEEALWALAREELALCNSTMPNYRPGFNVPVQRNELFGSRNAGTGELEGVLF